MITAVDIFDEVEADVATLNGEIVRRAFHGHCCLFFNNQEEFARLLKTYVNHRMMIHHLRVQKRIAYRQDCCHHSFPFYAQLLHHTEYAMGLRCELKKLWPCAACIWLYNPTHRIRRFPQLA